MRLRLSASSVTERVGVKTLQRQIDIQGPEEERVGENIGGRGRRLCSWVRAGKLYAYLRIV